MTKKIIDVLDLCVNAENLFDKNSHKIDQKYIDEWLDMIEDSGSEWAIQELILPNGLGLICYYYDNKLYNWYFYIYMSDGEHGETACFSMLNEDVEKREDLPSLEEALKWVSKINIDIKRY